MTLAQNLQDLRAQFIRINHEKGDIDLNDGKVWYLTHRSGDTGVGKTFEDLLGKKEDNYQLPDYESIELKAHVISDSLITLFTKSPNLPRGINTIIRDKYGYDEDNSGIKVLHSTVPSGRTTFNAKSQHYFTIRNNQDNQSVDLVVFDKDRNEIKSDVKAKWSYSAIEKALTSKMPDKLAIILTNKKAIKRKVYYNYKSILITQITLDTFLKALNDGSIYVDLRLGAYKSGKKKGMTHDHGTGFRISLKNLHKYTDIQTLI